SPEHALEEKPFEDEETETSLSGELQIDEEETVLVVLRRNLLLNAHSANLEPALDAEAEAPKRQAKRRLQCADGEHVHAGVNGRRGRRVRIGNAPVQLVHLKRPWLGRGLTVGSANDHQPKVATGGRVLGADSVEPRGARARREKSGCVVVRVGGP